MYKPISPFDIYNQFFASQKDLFLSLKKKNKINAGDTVKKKIKKGGDM